VELAEAEAEDNLRLEVEAEGGADDGGGAAIGAVGPDGRGSRDVERWRLDEEFEVGAAEAEAEAELTGGREYEPIPVGSYRDGRAAAAVAAEGCSV
jgi:hypothetical protein